MKNEVLISAVPSVFIHIPSGSNFGNVLNKIQASTQSWFTIPVLYISVCNGFFVCTHKEVRDKNNRSILHYACRGGSKDIVKYLIEELKFDLGKLAF